MRPTPVTTGGGRTRRTTNLCTGERDLDYDELILRSFVGRISSEQEVALSGWRNAHPDHERRYQEFAAVWRTTAELKEELVSEPPPVGEIISESADDRTGRRKWRPGSWQVAALAASFAAGLLLAGPSEDPGLERGQPIEIVTGPGETATMQLAGGTVVRVAPESQLVLPDATDERSVTLVGQAFFAVASDPENPFIVRTPSGVARVLGTRFELDARSGNLRLLVVEGRVNVNSGDAEVDVVANQMTHLREGQAPSTVDVSDVWPLLSWMGAFVAFESTPLHEVRLELMRRFDVTLTFDDPSLAQETVTVWFRNEPIEEVVSVLCRLVEAQCSMRNSLVRMTRGPETTAQ